MKAATRQHRVEVENPRGNTLFRDLVIETQCAYWQHAEAVSIDQEMTTLLALQSAYSANARVMSAIKDMLNALSNI